MENRQRITIFLFKKGLLLFLALNICSIFSLNTYASNNEEYTPGVNSKFSLLTASPGKEIYAQYGHTGIRFHDPDKPVDIVFNYGLFNFDSPNFIWRFVTGKTDYMVAAFPIYNFLLEYQMENRQVTEQVLNLNPAERKSLFDDLMVTIGPENRVYRYNFFYKNCSTQPRDIIEKSVQGKIDYQWNGKYKSLRDEVHYFTNNYPWIQFGIDFALGAKADSKSSLEIQQFAPDVLMESFSKAVIHNNSGGNRPLVIETRKLATIDPAQVEKQKSYPHPMPVMWAVFLITLIFTWLEIKKGKPNQLLNSIIYTVAGLVGFVIAFLVFFSEHPTTEVNYLLFWLHPAYLLYLPALPIRVFRKKYSLFFSAINLPFQVIALAGILFLPQYLNPAALPLLLALMLRSVSGIYFYRKKV
jgi:hypothetical protein